MRKLTSLGLAVGDLLRLPFENGDELVSPHVTCVFGALIFREFAFGRFLSEFFDAGL